MVIAESSLQNNFFQAWGLPFLEKKLYLGSRVLSVRLKKVCNFPFVPLMDEKTLLYWKYFIRQGLDKLMAILMNFSPTTVKSLRQ